MPRLSGLQKDVLSLYRQCLRACRTKPIHSRAKFESFTRQEFEKTRKMDKKDFGAVEFMLRKGHRQLEVFAEKNVTSIAG
ncbi:hypothetical protein K431DRAFT_223051 [Polychaeton citri CBS 116435]|uniref:Complex 1 LYR protein domain-containing protein n=1 Tax=Polychaeton citri CBS 116435 TaxID=1314669 RepID=A0A9P4URB4_9PEZI|nr:hypothetical protein K431DRAFT_223051 [Polychaeton citri CBS 116435]